MERIDFHGSFFSVPAKPSGNKASPKKAAKPGRGFFDLLGPRAEETEEDAQVSGAQAAQQDSETGIATALDEVHIHGEKLKKNATLKNVDDYKQAVRRFVKLILAACYKLEVSAQPPFRDGQKVYTQIRVINVRLEKLASQIMRGQKEELEILRRVDEIYGLLVDLRQ
ncbi:MAG: YaaR family protein [Spirochaetia bacterium]|jgi:uncharacterized protein YaaR (DUF327 family)|nr:YaaR family protein [Spirochaetia bacterium]